jgi:hypothetical protein
MTSLASPLPDIHGETRNLLPVKLAITLGLTALADWLFYDQSIGISMTLFAIALFAGSWLGNLVGLNWRRTATAALVLFAGLVPAVEELNGLTFLLIVAALAYAISILTNPDLKQLFFGRLGAFRDLYLIGPFRLAVDIIRMFSRNDLTAGFARWFVPVAFGLIFLLLFSSANPLIEKWIRELAPGNPASHINLARTLFWVFVLTLVWPFIHVRWRRKKQRAARSVEPVADNAEPRGEALDLFGADAILRSLILFNLLFAIQTVLDAVYLWGNAKLPPDVTYADYAHRGAYPLIVTALLAAGFVLAAMRPGGPAEKSPVIRPLVYLWVAQNVMMVASCILRLRLYVETYLLTTMRIAAFVWMLLVAVGLVLIVARIILEQSNGWLIRMNLISLTATLYVCALINFPAIIADYNVTHSKETSGKGVNLDTNYLYELGPQVLPALNRAAALPGLEARLTCSRNRLLSIQAADMASWRSWGFRSWRLQRWLDNHPDQPSNAG